MTKKLKMEISDLKNNISSMSREEKIKVLLDYAKECYKNGHKPSKKEIRRKFHVEIYNYFKNTPDYHRKAGIEVSLRNYPKEEAKKLIIDFIKNKAKDRVYPNRTEIESALKIHVTTYFKDLKELYGCANIDYSLVQKEIRRKILSAHTNSKVEIEKQRELIKNFIAKNVIKGFYPSIHHIQRNLNLSFYNLYDDIFEAYKDANVDYERPSPILLGRKKEKVFTKIVKELLVKIGFKIIRVSIESKIDFNRYADMTIDDKDGKKCLVEIKAYRKDYYITKREFIQLLNYMEKEKISNGIFITSSNTKKCDFSDLQFINGENLIELLKINGLSHYIKQIRWIQNSRVDSTEMKEYREFMKNKILEYIKMKNKIPMRKEIENDFRIDIRSIFGEKRAYEKLKKEAEILSSFNP